MMGGVEKCAPEVWFARDSPLEGDGFEPSVPLATVSSVVALVAPLAARDRGAEADAAVHCAAP